MNSQSSAIKEWLIVGVGSLLVVSLVTITVLSDGKGREPFLRLRSSSTAPNYEGSSSSAAEGSVTWSQPRIDFRLARGDNTLRYVSFTSTEDLSAVRLEAVPEIQGFLRLQPGTFANVSANNSQRVSLAVSIPRTATSGVYDGTIHLRTGNRTLPQTLKFMLTVTPAPQVATARIGTVGGTSNLWVIPKAGNQHLKG